MSVASVWCDFGGVLTPPIADAAAEVARAAGVPWDRIWRAIDEVAAAEGLHGMQPLELGVLSQAAWGARVEEALGVRPAIDLREWDRHWYRDRPVDAALLDVLAGLRRRGIGVGLLTNSVREWEPHRARLLRGYADVFQAVVRSHEVALAKPDPRIFAHAASLLPGPTLLIDDSAENCRAARAVGWRAHHHTDPAETRQLLHTLPRSTSP
ncbi:HAD family phosphatase [Microbacterium sp. X-17]|uniref:HAD family hydrolase n=1 Tax=Microbacterium sp. X-17 TaxID=3144404 RepID=UPI0031F528D6